MKVYTAAELAERNESGTNWVVHDGYIYDVAKFYAETPNGAELINKLAADQATMPKVYDILDGYIIGELEESKVDRRVNRVNAKFKLAGSVFFGIIFVLYGFLIYYKHWIWMFAISIIVVEILRKSYELHDELMERAGAHTD